MKNNFIILIGSDGAGKSTIARALSEKTGYPVEHHGPVKSYIDGKFEYLTAIKETNYSVIKDRFFEGERIYAPLYRGYSADYFPTLERMLIDKFNVLLVHVQPSFETILKRITERGEDFVKPEHFYYCYKKVEEVYNDSSLPKITVNTEHNIEQNVEKILETLFTV